MSDKTTTKMKNIAGCFSCIASFILSISVVSMGIVMILIAGMKIQDDVLNDTNSGRFFVPIMIGLGYIVMRTGEKVDK